MTSKDFTALPPMFEISISDKLLEGFLPNYKRYPDSFLPVIPYLLASLQHHYLWLTNALPETHPFRTSFIWRSGFLTKHKQFVRVDFGSSTIRTLIATGVPLALVTALEVSVLRNDFAAWKSSFAGSVAELRADISALNQSLPKELMQLIFENLCINGAVPLTEARLQVTESKLHEAVSNLESKLLERVESIIQRLTSAPRTGSQPSTALPSSNSSSLYGHFPWGDRLWNPFPESYVIPSCTMQAIWNLWFRGDLSTGIHPFRKIIPKFHIKNGNIQKYCRAKSVINAIVALVGQRQPGMTEDRIARLDDDGLNTIFQQAFEDLLKMLHDADVIRRQQELEDKGHVPKKQRLEDRNSATIKYNTIYKEINDLRLSIS